MQMTGEKTFKRGSRLAWTVLATLLTVLAFVLPMRTDRDLAAPASDGGALFRATSARADQSEYVHIGGYPIGISIGADGLIVQGRRPVRTADGDVDPAADSGIDNGDIIVSANGKKVATLYHLKKAIEEADGAVTLTLKRADRTFQAQILPAEDITGQKRLGLMLKEDVGGVGTLTFVTQDGAFGALGHFIQDGETGLADELQSGMIYPTSVDGVIKSEVGKAGGLQADVNRLLKPLGSVRLNALIGIFGDYAAQPKGELTRVARKGEAKMGAAQVLTTIHGDSPMLYDIDIVKVVSQNEADEKGMVISVRDKRLLDEAGGIVQGMSGSPIIQNGIFIGAVTHVFVQDPTRGYAVHSRFMVDSAYSFDYMQDAA